MLSLLCDLIFIVENGQNLKNNLTIWSHCSLKNYSIHRKCFLFWKIDWLWQFLLIKWANPGLLFVSFRSLQTNITIFTTAYVKKCPSGIGRWDSNPSTLGRESPPVTTRPELRPKTMFCLLRTTTGRWLWEANLDSLGKDASQTFNTLKGENIIWSVLCQFGQTFIQSSSYLPQGVTWILWAQWRQWMMEHPPICNNLCSKSIGTQWRSIGQHALMFRV